MVSYGPWTQDPDYESFSTWNISAQTNVLTKQGLTRHSGGSLLVTEDSDEPPPPYPTNPYINLPSMLSTALNMNNDAPPGVEPGGVSLRYGTAAPLLLARGQSEVRASAARVPLVPGYASAASPDGWRKHDYLPEVWPADAVDIEFEPENPEGFAEWLTAEIDPSTLLYGNIFEDITGTHELNQARVSRPFTSEIRVAPGWPGASLGTSVDVFETGPSDYDPDSGLAGYAGRTLGHTVPLTEHVQPSGGVMWLWTPDYVPSSIPPDGSAGSWVWSYGWGFERLRIRWMLRPPLYRWVYDSVPIRRTYPRDDGLAGGGRRTWPPSKAIQSSNRTSGGYL
jgi:hypothetical protein